MKASISLDGLLQFILSFSLSASNKRWLGEKLLEEARKEVEAEESEFISKEEVLAGIDAGLREMQERKRTGRRAKTLDALINEL